MADWNFLIALESIIHISRTFWCSTKEFFGMFYSVQKIPYQGWNFLTYKVTIDAGIK